MKSMKSDIKILVVDDERSVTDLLVRYFSFEGYSVTGCNDPLEALHLVKNDNYLICILDIQMPVMSGIDLLKEIKQLNGMTGVIMMTGFASLENILTCLRRGAETCFLKPLEDLEELHKAVKLLVRRFNDWQKMIKRLKAQAAEAKRKAV